MDQILGFLNTFFLCLFLFIFNVKEIFYSRKCSLYQPILILVKALLVFSPLIFFSGFRDSGVGIDTLRYSYEFDRASTLNPVLRPTEPIFTFLLVWLNKFGLSFGNFIFLQSFLYYLSIASCLALVPKRSYLAYALVIMCFGLFSFGLSGIRQSIAIAIFLFSIVFLIQDRKLAYLVFAVISFFVHNSSIVAFSLTFIAFRFLISPKIFLIFIFLSPLSALLNDSFIAIFSSLDVKQVIAYSSDGSELLNFKVPLAIWFFSLIIMFGFQYGKRLSVFDLPALDLELAKVRSLLMWGAFFVCCFFWMATSVRLMDRLGFYFIPFIGLLTAWLLGSLRETMLGWLVRFGFGAVLLVFSIVLNRDLILSYF